MPPASEVDHDHHNNHHTPISRAPAASSSRRHRCRRRHGCARRQHAADADSKVWVCKYVGTPGDDERLKEGKNPIGVSGHSVDKDKDGQVFVGDQFADAQGRSVIVQIGGDSPVQDLLPDSPAGPAERRDYAGRRRTGYGWRARRRPRRPGRGRGTARRSRPRGSRGGAASPGGHPSVTSTCVPARPRAAARTVGDVDACGRPAERGRRAPQGPTDRQALRVSETPPLKVRPLDGPGSHARSGSCARSPWCSASLASSWS